MSLDLYEREIRERLDAMPKTMTADPSVWDGFARGVGLSAMEFYAKAVREVSLAASVPILLAERHPLNRNGTELSDRYFRWHDEVFQSAVDAWTPNSAEIGVAGRITGQLLATLPMVIASPAAAVGVTGLSTAEDLVRKGVEPGKAIAVGGAHAAGLGLGIWMPVLGRTLAERVLVGGAGFNLVQGVGTRAASELILEGTPAAEEFKAFDWSAVTLDVLLGLAFGGIAHLSPRSRAQGQKVWEQLSAWSQRLRPSDVDALLVQRQAQHLNVDSLPGRPVDAQSVDAHVQRARTALDQLARDERVEVTDLPEGRFEPDEPRLREMAARAQELVRVAEQVRKAEGLPPVPETEGPPAPTVRAEPPPPRGEGGEAPARPEAEPATPAEKAAAEDPAIGEARLFVAARGDLELTVGRDADGMPVRTTLKAMLEESDAQVKLANEDAKLFEVAAACMLGH